MIYIRKIPKKISVAIFVAIFSFVVILFSQYTNVSRASTENNSELGRLVTIHDGSLSKTVLAQGVTIGDAIKEAEIVLDNKDAVEPSLDTTMTASNYDVNIYRARPVIVIDGGIRTRVITPYQTASQIASDAGLTIYDEDILELSRSDDILADGAGLRLTVKRAILVNMILYGKNLAIRTQATTVDAMLKEKNIIMDKSDKLSVDVNSRIIAGMSMRLWREGRQTTTVEEDVPFDIEQIENADQPVSYRQINTAGVNGKRNVTYDIVIEDGKEVSRTEIASIVTEQPIKQVETIGVMGKYTTPTENENITWNYLISKGYSRVQTAGIMGNLMQEHRFNTSGDGLAQWTGGRKAELYSWDHPENIYTQLDFLYYELSGKYAGVNASIRATDSIVEAVQIFQNRFERCGICMESRRIEYARNILASH